MTTYQRILCATDLSPTAEHMRPLAVALAQASGAELHVLHVNVLSALHGLNRKNSAITAQVEEMMERGKEALEAIPDEGGLTTHRVVRSDESPARAILDYAQEADADLIVMGTSGMGDAKRWLLGSVAAKVLRSAPVSVLVANPTAARLPSPAIRRVLATTDLSMHSRESVRHAAMLAAQHAAELRVLHVMPAPVVAPYAAEYAAYLTDVEVGGRALAAFVDSLDLPVAAEQEVVLGSPAPEIVSAASEHGVDLVVVAAYGLSAARRLVLGSVADRIVRDADCPVLVYRPAPG